MSEELKKLCNELCQEVVARSDTEDYELLREDQFTEIMIEYLVEAGELDDGRICFNKMKGHKVNGYHISDDGDRLDLFITECFLNGELNSLPKSSCINALKRLQTFFQRALGGVYKNLEDASDAFDLAHSIYQSEDMLVRVRLYLFTDGLTKVEELPHVQVGDVEVSFHIWDLNRLFQTVILGRRLDRIVIDFEHLSEQPVQCLIANKTSENYRCIFAVFSAKTLVNLYSKYGPRLLERNVRSFLQARGNINKGIRQTITKEPDMFLAYNNGLSATCSNLEVVKGSENLPFLKRASDFQIVNGGQTTGSLFHAFKKDGADLANIFVPVKITEINGEDIDLIAPKISQYANSQNKVNMADFSANHPYHIKIQEFSRTIFAPPKAGGQKQTHWYYERARGQYLDEKGRGTVSQRNAFEALNPNRQKFTKTDLGKYENSWAQLPHLVSKGAQKNFLEFMQRLDKRGKYEPDEAYFKKLIARAILFKETDRIVARELGGAYKAQTVTYAIAWLSYRSEQRLDLDGIWSRQELGPILSDCLESICQAVQPKLVQPPGIANVTEWCKKEACWDVVKPLSISLSDQFESVLIPETQHAPRGIADIDEPNDDEVKIIELVSKISSETWFSLSKWAKETQNLLPWQRSLAYSLGRVAESGRRPSRKQAAKGIEMLEKANNLGFKHESVAYKTTLEIS